jgi:hypothetical protein
VAGFRQPGTADRLPLHDKKRVLKSMQEKTPFVREIQNIILARTMFGGLSRQQNLLDTFFQEVSGM